MSNNGRMYCYHQFLVSCDLGGAGMIALHLARHLREQGQDSRAWVPGEGPASAATVQMGLPWDVYDAVSLLSASRVRAGIANWKLGRRLRESGRGIVHVHSPLCYGALRRGLRSSALKRVVQVQIEEGEDGLRWAFKDPPELIVPCARFLVSTIERSLPEGALGRTRIVPVHNAVDTQRFMPGPKEEAKRRVGAPLGRPLALMLANLAPHKGQETAIRAVAHLKQRGVDVTCWLAGVERGGEEAYTHRLQALIAEAGVGDRVVLLGQRSDTPDLQRAADFLLLPSTHEGLPLAILEAQATRVPVIAAPTAGVPEVIRDGETGFLLPAEDAEGYARRMEQLLAEPELARRVADAAFQRTTREYNWQTFCRRITALYDELLEGPAVRRAVLMHGA
ncbi:MAG TPA: glycosyltransferase family 4 protein [Gemmataceae bacterium]|jgi:glycosyltransferase involved in cell wall biosynthesis